MLKCTIIDISFNFSGEDINEWKKMSIALSQIQYVFPTQLIGTIKVSTPHDLVAGSLPVLLLPLQTLVYL